MVLTKHHISLIAGMYNMVWFFSATTVGICTALSSGACGTARYSISVILT
jgi:hypothetical protein